MTRKAPFALCKARWFCGEVHRRIGGPNRQIIGGVHPDTIANGEAIATGDKPDPLPVRRQPALTSTNARNPTTSLHQELDALKHSESNNRRCGHIRRHSRQKPTMENRSPGGIAESGRASRLVREPKENDECLS